MVLVLYELCRTLPSVHNIIPPIRFVENLQITITPYLLFGLSVMCSVDVIQIHGVVILLHKAENVVDPV